MGKRQRRRFTDEYKAEAVRLVRGGGMTVTQVARDLDLTESSLRNWIKQAEVDEGEGPRGAATSAELEELRRLRRENRELRMEREIPKKRRPFLREGKRMRYAFILAEKAFYPVAILCRVLEVSRSGFYAWLQRNPSRRELRDRQLRAEIAAIHKESRKTYGSPRVHAEFKARRVAVSRKRIARLMREAGITGRPIRPFRCTTDSAHEHPVAENLLDHQFEVTAPNQAWAADITYVRTWEGWLYLAVVIDLFSRRVVGWALATHLRAGLVLSALDMALGLRQPGEGLLHHSDRGSQYASTAYRDVLAERGISCSMSRRGDCWDNAVVESFLGTLKTELIYRRPWPSRREAEAVIAEYVEVFYNRHRRHSYLGFLSPANYEEAHRNAALAA
ncbi:MAG: IS3 family transposase [Nitrospira sp.]|nr:IS3 family transposase [Nitrospira sp.]